jgi:peptide/nickel transport system permease protein
MAALEVGSIILAIASYSFIGLGEQPPTPEWGVMLSDGREFMQTQPQLILFPGLLIIITVLAFNLFGEGLKNALHQ